MLGSPQQFTGTSIAAPMVTSLFLMVLEQFSLKSRKVSCLSQRLYKSAEKWYKKGTKTIPRMESGRASFGNAGGYHVMQDALWDPVQGLGLFFFDQMLALLADYYPLPSSSPPPPLPPSH
jgi:hypothetical protein